MPELSDSYRLKAIFETAIDGIITIDERGYIDAVNPAAARLFGYERGELTGKNISSLMPEPYQSAHDQYLANYRQTGQGKIIGIGREVIGLKKSGETFPFRLAVGEVRLEAGGRFFTGIIHDLSQQKQQEAQLRRYAAELERSNRELENFAYISSHDLQEPLRKIQAFGSRILSREGEHLTPQGRDYLERIQRASARLQNLINDLLAFSRVSSRAKPFVSVSLNQILDEVRSDLEIAITEAEAIITVGELPTLEADPTQMRQLFQNLLANAIKFRQSARSPRINVSAQPVEPVDGDCERYLIAVADNGIGFEEKYLDRIFNIFQRLEGRKYEGSGIGLAICRKIALRHGGDLTARSQPGQGTTFLVTLPLHQQQPASAALPSVSHSTTREP